MFFKYKQRIKIYSILNVIPLSFSLDTSTSPIPEAGVNTPETSDIGISYSIKKPPKPIDAGEASSFNKLLPDLLASYSAPDIITLAQDIATWFAATSRLCSIAETQYNRAGA